MEFFGYRARGIWIGCYLPLELWTPGSSGELGKLPEYIKQVSDAVAAQQLMVSMSPFISDLAGGDPTATQTSFLALLSDAKVNIVALQDGVGARGLTAAHVARQIPFYRAMKSACQNRCEVWANVESFSADFKTPAPWDRFRAQMLGVIAETPQQITFEYSHFWMESGPGGAKAKALHDAYAQWRMNTP
jgi:hypothetical protein